MLIPNVRVTSHYFNLNDEELLLLIDWYVDVEETVLTPEHWKLLRRLGEEARKRGLNVPAWAAGG